MSYRSTGKGKQILRLITRNPFVVYGLMMMWGFLFNAGLERLGHGYEDNGLGSLAFLLSIAWNFVAFPFYFVSEGLRTLNNGQSQPHHELITALIVFAGLPLLDLGWRHYKDTR